MSRLLSFLIAFIVLVGAFLVTRYVVDNTIEKTQVEPGSAEKIDPQLAMKFHTWREYSEPSGDFKALFPSLPQHAADSIADPSNSKTKKYDTYVAADETGQIFTINAITLSEKINPDKLEALLKDVVNDMVNRNKENKIKFMKINDFKNRKSLDFAVTNDQILIDGKVFATDDKIYVLSIISTNEAFNEQELNFFVNSFNLSKDKAPKSSGLKKK